MNKIFTHRKLNNLVLKVSDFCKILTTLPAGPRFAVNILLVHNTKLVKLQVISKAYISNIFEATKPELQVKPVVFYDFCSLQQQINICNK